MSSEIAKKYVAELIGTFWLTLGGCGTAVIAASFPQIGVHYGLLSALITEVVLTMMFLFVIMGATHGKAPAGFAPIAIGLCLTLIHLVSIPVTNTSVNPARSTGPALFVGGWAIGQLWLFWIAPTLGGAAGGVLYRWLSDEPSAQVTGSLPNHHAH